MVRLAAACRWVRRRRHAGQPGFGGAQVGEGSGAVVQRGTEVPAGEATHASRGGQEGCCGSWVLGAAGTRCSGAACTASGSGGGRHGKQRRHGLAGIDGGNLRGEQLQAPRTSENAGAQQGAEAAAASGHTSAMGAGRVGTSVRQSGGSGAFSWLDGQAAVRPAHGERRWSVPVP